VTGLIFQPFSIEKILSGDKTATRRILRLWPLRDGTPVRVARAQNLWTLQDERGVALGCTYRSHGVGSDRYVKERYLVRDGRTLYEADGGHDDVPQWGNPIFMPERCARIIVRIEAVRLHRIHTMTDQDARAEGAASLEEFRERWDTLHERPFSWDSNPWVAAYSFSTRRIAVSRP